MNEEYAQLPVHGRHLGYARSQLAQMGIPSNVIGQNGNIYIILIPASAAPMVQGAPWMYQGESWAHGLARFPWIRLMLVGGAMLAMLYFCQAAGIMAGLVGMTWNPEIQAAVEAQKAEESENIQADEAILSTVIMAVGVPLLFTLVAVAAWLILRMRKRP